MRRLAAELTVYAAVALVLVRKAFGQAVGTHVDLPGTLWWHQWTLEALSTGQNPAYTHAFYHPTGLDLFVRTGANLIDGLVAAPWLAALGMPAYSAPFVATLLVLNALAMRTLLRDLSPVACVSGALLFELHPYVLFELAEARPTQALLAFFPLFLHFLLRGRGVLAGLMLGLQAWTYWFNGHFFLLTLAIPLAVHLRAHLRPMASAAATTLVLVGPAVFWMWRNRETVPWYHGSLEQGLTAWTPWRPDGFALHWGALLVAVAALAGCRRRALWIPAAALALLLATELPGLYDVGEALLPGFKRLLWPYRALALLALVAPVAAAEALDRLPTRWALPAAGLALFIGTSTLTLPATDIPIPAYVAAVRKDPAPVLVLPWLCSSSSAHLQPQHGSPLFSGDGDESGALVPTYGHALESDPLLGPIAAASRGEPPETDPTGAALERPVWVVLHREAYRPGPLLGRKCWTGDPMGAENRVNAYVQRRLGRPDVEDEHAVAWRVD